MAAGKTEVATLVAQSPWFAGLPANAHEALVAEARVRTYPADSYLYTAGQFTDAVFGILSGRVRVSISSTVGQMYTVIDLEPGTWLGEAVLVDDAPRGLEAQASIDSEIVIVPRAVVLQVAEQHPLLYKNLFSAQIVSVRGVYELLAGMLFYPLKARLAGRLLDLLDDHGQQAEDGVYLNVALSQNDFAKLCLGSRQRINKIFREWSSEGLVLHQNDRYFITDVERLRRELVLVDK